MVELLTLDIESIAAGGHGVARHEGLVVFVPRTAPGDRAVARVERRGRLGRGLLERVVVASPLRVEPACRHYVRDRCGGCQLQHLALDAQREAKRAIVRDTLRRIGRRDVALPDIRAGSAAWRYRRKLTLTLRPDARGLVAGLHAHDDPARVFALEDCDIADERLLVLWRAILARADCLPRVPAMRGTVRLVGDAGVFVLEGARRWDGHADLFESVPGIVAVWWTPEGGKRRLLHDRRGTAEPLASFVQVNPEVAEMLTAHVLDRILSRGPSHVVDAYAGAGEVAARLAARGVRVTAIEMDPEAARWTASRLTGGSRAVTARVERALSSALPADVVLVNPPRAGLDASVAAALDHAAGDTRALLYVSCDPATLARDLSRLPSWRIAHLLCFDMFPQTAHVETVVELVPEATP